MTADLAALLTTLARRTGARFDAGDFDSRLRIQKVIYLLAQLGHPVANRYAWGHYFHGPYSPALAKDYYALRERSVQPNTAVQISEPALGLVAGAIGKGNEFLEAATTLHSIATANRGASKPEVMRIVQAMKPYLTGKLEEAWQYLAKAKLGEPT